ncbi:MAG: DNA-processing protein DprA [Fimbriimonadaceae bacterium]|nr:DNA-processing protein DprA [Fimbriimonadaceae bacterium]
MLRGDWHAGRCVFACLYLPVTGWQKPPTRYWPKVLAALREDSIGAAEQRLRAAGLWHEASVLAEPGRLALAEQYCEREQVLTVCDAAYPAGWLNLLGDTAPPALWRLGEVPTGLSVGVVGSRELTPGQQQFAVGLGHVLRKLGYGMVSGAARGADSMVAQSFGDSAVHILPCGMNPANSEYGYAVYLSPFEPECTFTGQQAMIRNRLIYAWSGLSVVVHSRFKVGGTWGGVTEALRKRNGRVIVPQWGCAASAALVALGGVGLPITSSWPEQLAFLLRQPLPLAQPDLFGAEVVRERRLAYGV